jgi:hypothetical protein
VLFFFSPPVIVARLVHEWGRSADSPSLSPVGGSTSVEAIYARVGTAIA